MDHVVGVLQKATVMPSRIMVHVMSDVLSHKY